MIRSLAASFAALAMAVLTVRGAIAGRHADLILTETLVRMAMFAVLGGVAGWVLDYAIREHLRVRFADRVRWYCDGVAAMANEGPADEPPKSDRKLN